MSEKFLIKSGLDEGKMAIKLNQGDKILLPTKDEMPELYLAGGFFANNNIQFEFVDEQISEIKIIENKEILLEKEQNIEPSNDETCEIVESDFNPQNLLEDNFKDLSDIPSIFDSPTKKSDLDEFDLLDT